MTQQLFSLIFLSTLTIGLTLHIWLALRHLRHIVAHRNVVPEDFAGRIDLAAHRKAADYTCAKTRLSLVELGIGQIVLLTLTFGGLLQICANFCAEILPDSPYLQGLALFGCVSLIGFVIDLPLSIYRCFVLEERFGFNQMTWRIFLADLIKGGLLTLLIGTPLLLVVLWLMTAMGAWWWLHVWLFWLTFNLLAMIAYPTLIAPLFNKFQPLDDADLKTRIETLLTRCGFRTSGLFVMDGSKRSAHGNAYFTGFGAAKRIVFFDTLLKNLAPQEIEAVLAHELGHYRHRHVWKRIGLLAALTLAAFGLLGLLLNEAWFYHGLGVTMPDEAIRRTAMALVLFSLTLPVFSFPLSPLLSSLSRRHEYEADAYAARQTHAADLVNALVKLYRDNASTLTPDPLHSLFHDSHPPAALRIAHLRTL